MTKQIKLPEFRSYGNYSSSNYGVNSLEFTDINGHRFFYSYKTLVAVIVHGIKLVRKNEWGTTTGKHLNWIDNGNKNERLSEEDFNKQLNLLLK